MSLEIGASVMVHSPFGVWHGTIVGTDWDSLDAARAVESARVKHQARADRSLRRNVGAIMNAYHERDREIRREGVYMAWATCPLAAFVFGGVSWYNLDRGDVLMGVLCALFGLSFLVMLVLAQLRRKGGR